MLWWKQILSRIRESELFIYLASPASLESQACLREMRYAIALRKSILPILIADQIQTDSLPVAIQSLQLLNYSKPDKTALFSLAKALQGLPPSPPLPDPLPPYPAMPASYISELREAVESDGVLTFEAQTSLLVKLREQLKLQEKSTAVREVLQKFRRRKDLFAIVAEEIDEIETPTPKFEKIAPIIPADNGQISQATETESIPSVPLVPSPIILKPHSRLRRAAYTGFHYLFAWGLALLLALIFAPPLWQEIAKSDLSEFELGVAGTALIFVVVLEGIELTCRLLWVRLQQWARQP